MDPVSAPIETKMLQDLNREIIFPIFLDRSNTGEVAPGTGARPWGREHFLESSFIGLKFNGSRVTRRDICEGDNLIQTW